MLQNGCTFNSLGVLSLVPQPPIPSLNFADFQSVASTPIKNAEVSVTLNPGKMKREELNLHFSPSNAVSIPTPSSGGDDAEFDEFTDFQSAVSLATETVAAATSVKDPVSVGRPPENQSNTVGVLGSGMATAQKCPSVIVVGSSGHGRGIGSRLANHSLSTPKQKKTKHHHHHHHHRSQPQVTSPSDEDFTEYQQAKDPCSSGDGTAGEIFSKCMARTPQGKMYFLKESAIRTEMKSDSNQKAAGSVEDGGPVSFEASKSDFEHIIQRRNASLTSEKSKSDENGQDQNVPLGVQNMEPGPKSTSVSDPQDSKREGVNLMSVDEDKYSALRVLSLVGQDTSLDKPELSVSTEQSPASDDFGDFLSAEPSGGVDDSFADTAAREKVPNKNISDLSAVGVWKAADMPQTAEFPVDDWGEYKAADIDQTFDMTSENKLSATANKMKTETDFSAVLMDLHLGEESNEVWGLKDSIGVAGEGKEKASDFLSLAEPSLDLNTDSSWHFKSKVDSDGLGDTALSGSKRGQNTNFQEFIDKIYDSDVKNEHYSLKVDLLCPSPNDRLHGGRSDSPDIDIQTHDSNDDFGEFVGPNTWSDGQKYNIMMKDILFDGHLGQGLYSDNQSVSSLELPPLTLSRHGSVPSLDLKIFPSTADKNGGNQPWDMSPQVCNQKEE
jgi:hypothetical protein